MKPYLQKIDSAESSVQNNKLHNVISTEKRIVSAWSPVMKLWSEEPSSDEPDKVPLLADTKKFTAGSDVYVYSGLTATVNKRDLDQNAVILEMDQFGFFSHHYEKDGLSSGSDEFLYFFSEFHPDKENLTNIDASYSFSEDNFIASNDKNIDGSVDPVDVKIGDGNMGNNNSLNLSMAPHFVLYRGEDVNIKAQTHYGGNMDFYLEPEEETLPEGLSFDPATGSISGTLATKFEPKEYVISARNPLGETSYTFYLEGKDQFVLTNNTASEADYMLHKMGQGRQHTDCRITEAQIKNYQTNERDIICTLDAPEFDLNTFGVSLNLDVGPNICEYVRITPYSYNKYQGFEYIKSGTRGQRKVYEDAAKTAGTISTNELHTVDETQNAKVFRQYSIPDGCKTCYHPRIKKVSQMYRFRRRRNKM